VGGVGGVQHRASREGDLRRPAVVDIGRGQQPDPAVTVLEVVPAEEPLAERSGVLDRAEPVREGRVVFEGLELALAVGIVVRDVRAAVGEDPTSNPTDPGTTSALLRGISVPGTVCSG
jgi:hypothetical protein